MKTAIFLVKRKATYTDCSAVSSTKFNPETIIPSSYFVQDDVLTVFVVGMQDEIRHGSGLQGLETEVGKKGI